MAKARIPLGHYITEYSVRNKSNEDIPVYSVTNSQGFCTEYFGKEVASQDKSTYKIVPWGYFAYNPSRINVGSVDWQRNNDRVIVSPLYNVFSVSDDLDRQYLYYFLKSDYGRQIIKEKASGSVRDNLKLDMLKEITIPHITLEEQKECVSILDGIQTTIRLRQQELQKLDELVKARFVEMFEQQEYNTAAAGTFLFGMRNGVSPSTKGQHSEKVLTLSAITQGAFDPDAWKNGLFDDCPPPEKRVTTSDFYMCRGNGNRNLVGSGVYSNFSRPDLVFPDTVIAACIDESQICMPYLSYAWKQPSTREQIESAARTTNGTYKINQSIVSGIKVVLPPLDKQKEFAEFVYQLDKSKVVVQDFYWKMSALGGDKTQLLVYNNIGFLYPHL